MNIETYKKIYNHVGANRTFADYCVKAKTISELEEILDTCRPNPKDMMQWGIDQNEYYDAITAALTELKENGRYQIIIDINVMGKYPVENLSVETGIIQKTKTREQALDVARLIKSFLSRSPDQKWFCDCGAHGTTLDLNFNWNYLGRSICPDCGSHEHITFEGME